MVVAARAVERALLAFQDDRAYSRRSAKATLWGYGVFAGLLTIDLLWTVAQTWKIAPTGWSYDTLCVFEDLEGVCTPLEWVVPIVIWPWIVCVVLGVGVHLLPGDEQSRRLRPCFWCNPRAANPASTAAAPLIAMAGFGPQTSPTDPTIDVGLIFPRRRDGNSAGCCCRRCQQCLAVHWAGPYPLWDKDCLDASCRRSFHWVSTSSLHIVDALPGLPQRACICIQAHRFIEVVALIAMFLSWAMYVVASVMNRRLSLSYKPWEAYMLRNDLNHYHKTWDNLFVNLDHVRAALCPRLHNNRSVWNGQCGTLAFVDFMPSGWPNSSTSASGVLNASYDFNILASCGTQIWSNDAQYRSQGSHRITCMSIGLKYVVYITIATSMTRARANIPWVIASYILTVVYLLDFAMGVNVKNNAFHDGMHVHSIILMGIFSMSIVLFEISNERSIRISGIAQRKLQRDAVELHAVRSKLLRKTRKRRVLLRNERDKPWWNIPLHTLRWLPSRFSTRNPRLSMPSESVSSAEWKTGGLTVAVRCFPTIGSVSKETDPAPMMKLVQQEMTILALTRHPNILLFLGASISYAPLLLPLIVTEWMSLGSLIECFDDPRQREKWRRIGWWHPNDSVRDDDDLSARSNAVVVDSQCQAKTGLCTQMMVQLASAVRHLHALDFVHGGIALNCVLVDSTFRVKLGSFRLREIKAIISGHSDSAIASAPVLPELRTVQDDVKALCACIAEMACFTEMPRLRRCRDVTKHKKEMTTADLVRTGMRDEILRLILRARDENFSATTPTSLEVVDAIVTSIPKGGCFEYRISKM